MATKLPWAEITEDWKMSCTMTGHLVWGKMLVFLVGFSILWDGNSKACLSPSVWTCGCGTAWVLLGEPLVAGEMLLVFHSSITSEPSFLTPYQPGLWEEEVKWGSIYWFIAQRWFRLLPKPIRSVLGHSDWHRSSISQCQWPRCGELIVQQILCCLGEISWGFADGQWF